MLLDVSGLRLWLLFPLNTLYLFNLILIGLDIYPKEGGWYV